MKIGEIELKYGLFLAPMAGFSDRAMRRVCYEMGAEYSVSEMISAKAVTFGDKKTFSLAAIRSDEGPVALQIFGSGQYTMDDLSAYIKFLAENQQLQTLFSSIVSGFSVSDADKAMAAAAAGNVIKAVFTKK